MELWQKATGDSTTSYFSLSFKQAVKKSRFTCQEFEFAHDDFRTRVSVKEYVDTLCSCNLHKFRSMEGKNKFLEIIMDDRNVQKFVVTEVAKKVKGYRGGLNAVEQSCVNRLRALFRPYARALITAGVVDLPLHDLLREEVILLSADVSPRKRAARNERRFATFCTICNICNVCNCTFCIKFAIIALFA